MLNGDRSQWSIEELRAEERAVAKRRECVIERACEIRTSVARMVDVLDECAAEISVLVTWPHWTKDALNAALQSGALRIAEREIPPVSLQDIADELVGDIHHETE